jgi:N-acetylmuramoyl-L-alanine amidase
VLPAGEKASAVGRNSSNNWIQIEFGNTSGWVAAWLTVYNGDTALLPITSIVEPEPLDGPGPFEVTSPFTVNIRSAPSVGAEILTRMAFGDSAQAIARNDLSSWVQVNFGGTTGWAARWLVLLSGDVAGLPTEGGQTGPFPGGTPQPGGATPVAPSAPPTPPPGGGIAVKPPFRVNLRSAPSLTAPVIDILLTSSDAVAIGKNAGNNWLQVSHDGTVGWVARWVVNASDDTKDLPITDTSIEKLAFNGVITIKSVYDVIIRAQPSLSGASIGVLPAFAPAPAIVITAEGNWIKINNQGTEGWVASWVVTGSNDYTNLPVEGSSAP